MKQQKRIYVAKLDGIKSLNVTLCRKFDYCHGWTGKNMNCEETDRKSLGFFCIVFHTRNVTVHMITHRHPRMCSSSVKLLV